MSKFRWLGVLILLVIIVIAVRYVLKSKTTQNDSISPSVIGSQLSDSNNILEVQNDRNANEISDDENEQFPSLVVPAPPNSGQQPGLPGQQPGLLGQQPGLPGQQPGLTGQQPGLPGQQPGLLGQQLGLTGQQPGLTGQQPGLTGQQPGLTGQQPGLTGQQPGLTGKVDTVKKNEQSKNSQEIEYIIQEGDTLGKICKEHYNNASLATALQKYNEISDPRKMKPNHKIKLPPIEKLGQSSKKTVAENKKTTEKQTSNSKVVQQNKAGQEHKIQKGETLGKISQKYYNTATLATALQKYNDIADPSKLQIGQTIIIPSKEVLQPNKTNGNKQVQSKNTSNQDSKYYIVQRGDNLPEIARKLKTNPSAIMNCNPEIAKDPEKIIPGMKILKPAN